MVDIGKAGENFAARYLRKNGYQILERNYRSRFGEIDMIAGKGEYIVFVEVKTRRPGAMVSPLESVTPSKQDKIRKTARFYLAAHHNDLQPRFDVACLTEAPGKHGFAIEYFENAFN